MDLMEKNNIYPILDQNMNSQVNFLSNLQCMQLK